MTHTRTALLAALFLAGLTAYPASAQGEKVARTKNKKTGVSVIFFIGDGMGTSQLTLGKLAAQYLKQPYAFDRFKKIGLANTKSANLIVTDSAASGTALASGIKTNNKVVGQDPSGKAVQTILELAHTQGYATGLVSTARITHATPAAFAAHVKHRRMERQIAAQYVEKAKQGYPQVLIGGGLRSFSQDKLTALRGLGYAVVTETRKLAAAKGPKLAAFLAESHVPFAVDGGTILPAMTKKAVEALHAQGRPFFLMVEGGRVDHGCHQHDAIGALHDQLDLGKAIGWTLDWAKRRDDVLIVVTADHATGNLGISEKTNLKGLLEAKASATLMARSRSKRPLEARVKEATGVTLTAAELTLIRRRKGPYWGATVLGHILSHRLGVHFYDAVYQLKNLNKTYGHDGAMVPVFAWGAGADRFVGLYENTEIPRRIAAILGFPKLAGTSAGAGKDKKFFK